MKRILTIALLVSSLAACTTGRYAKELNQCVVLAKTLDESRQCRCRVSKEYGRRCDNDATEKVYVTVDHE